MIRQLDFTKAVVSLVPGEAGHELVVELEGGVSARWVLGDLLVGSVAVEDADGFRAVDGIGRTVVDTRTFQATLTVRGMVREASGGMDAKRPRPA